MRDFVRGIHVNWYYTTEFGEEYENICVTDENVRTITKARDFMSYRVIYNNGSARDYHNINTVFHFSGEEAIELNKLIDLNPKWNQEEAIIEFFSKEK